MPNSLTIKASSRWAPGLRGPSAAAGGRAQGLSAPRRRLAVRAYQDDKDDKAPATPDQKVKELQENLRKSGLDSNKAKMVLQAWSRKVGHEVTGDDLRTVLTKQARKITGLVALQILIDVGAAYGSWTAASYLTLASPKLGLLSALGGSALSLLAGYYAAGAIFDTTKLVALVLATNNFNVDSAAFLAAVRQVAGASSSQLSGLGVADKLSEASSSVKVLQALGSMADTLKEQGAPGSQTSMLSDLGAYLTLERAEKQYGFSAKEFGLTDEQAGQVAVAFAQYDLNDDGVLSLDEFRKLCSNLMPELSGADVEAAFRTVDKDKSGVVEFPEFAGWWTAKK